MKTEEKQFLVIYAVKFCAIKQKWHAGNTFLWVSGRLPAGFALLRDDYTATLTSVSSGTAKKSEIFHLKATTKQETTYDDDLTAPSAYVPAIRII